MRNIAEQEIRQIKAELLAGMDGSREWADEEIYAFIRDRMESYAHRRGFSFRIRKELEMQIYNSLRRLDVLQELVEDNAVTEIMVNGADSIFYEKNGQIRRWEKRFAGDEDLMNVIQQIVAVHNRMVNESSPIVDTRLPDGSRVNVVLPPVALNGPCLSIRKFPQKPFQMNDLIARGMLSQEVADFLQKLVAWGYNIFISGGTSSGKTTFLNALSAYIPKGERIITIEDSAELQIAGIENLIRLETRNENMEGSQEISIRDLIRTALRMRPDRIVVGEVRGAEALDMLQAMNTGHDGSLSTGHANSSLDMLHRLETMVLMGMELPLQAVQMQIVSGLDILIHLGRMKGGKRRLLEVSELLGCNKGQYELQTLYQFRQEDERGETKGTWERAGELKNRKRQSVHKSEQAKRE